jgi:hypothetical protein
MIFHCPHSNKSLVIALTSAVVIDGVLTAVVLHRHHDHSTANEQLSLRTAPSVSIPAGANIVVPPNAVAHPNPATTPDPVDTSAGSAAPVLASPNPQTATTPTTPVLNGSAPQILRPSQQAPAAHKPLKPKRLPHRRINSLPASPSLAAAVPVPAAPQTSPATPAKPAKPGAPPGF